jgi:hypothetical protein
LSSERYGQQADKPGPGSIGLPIFLLSIGDAHSTRHSEAIRIERNHRIGPSKQEYPFSVRIANPYILPIDLCIEATLVRIRSWREFYLLEMNPRSQVMEGASMTRPKTTILVDGGDPKETRQVKELLGFVDGQTTNPSLIAKNPQIKELIASGHKLSNREEMDEYRKSFKQSPHAGRRCWGVYRSFLG